MTRLSAFRASAVIAFTLCLAVRAQDIQMSAAEYSAYNRAMQQTDPAAKATALEAYLAAYPQSAARDAVLETLIATYASTDQTRILPTADRLLQADPANLRALTYETYLRRSAADSITDPAAKQSTYSAAADYARRGLAASRPANLSDADFHTLQSGAYPIFFGAIGIDALNRKDYAGAIDAYRNELASVTMAQTQTPGPTLEDTFLLGFAYEQSSAPDYLRCAFYTARAIAYAPDSYKTQFLPTAKYCYRKYHGGDDGYDALVSVATANLNPPPGFYVKPAPTAAEIVHDVVTSTPDLATLAISDKEFILQNGSPQDTASVWSTIKNRSFEIPSALVIDASPGQLHLAISDDAVQAHASDFTVRVDPAAPLPTAGSKVRVAATYDSFTASPLMIFMRDGRVVTPGSTRGHGYGAAQAPTPHAAQATTPTPPPATVAANRTVPPPPAAAPAASSTRAWDLQPAASSSPSPSISSTASAAAIPHNYALIFATDNYVSWPQLQNPIFDADTLADTLHSLYGFQVEEAKDQTNAQIIAKLTEYLHRKFQPQDQLLIFFSGHGFFDPDLGQGFIVPANAARPQDDPGHLTLVAHDTIMRYVDSIPSQHVVLVLDACFAGTLDRKIAQSGLRGDPSMDIYTHATLSQLLARKEPKRTRRYFASGGKDFVPDGLPGHHSPFMSALLVALNQAADRKGYATLDDLQQGLETVTPEPRWGDIQDNNEPGADFLLLTPTAAAQVSKGN